ncbi:hypothetical protein DFH07DRAFT_859431 [Mycena maculata]|uniref:Dolichyl-diphosphooligosaccharide-protein glycosyltransferase subunit OST5 n=1 Tax=Mycena maculata TaxID=230809 RepID=A0AAD7MJI5_9AGAR|nr:hypothetical protein DFH07DRAFT_859431 [Mycena maculata]
MASYNSLQSLYTSSPAFSPLVPVALLPYIAFTLLFLTFTLAFYVSTLKKDTIPVRETAVSVLASALGGFGVVALFCTAGVNV